MSNERELFEEWWNLERARVQEGRHDTKTACELAYKAGRASTTMQDDLMKDAERYRWISKNYDTFKTLQAKFDGFELEYAIYQAIDKARE